MNRSSRTRLFFARLLVFVLFLLISSNAAIAQDESANGEDPLWVLAEHDLKSEEQRSDISAIISQGYLPVGIEHRDGSLWTLYYAAPEISISRWTLQEFERLDTLDQDFSRPMTEGWVPMAISRTENGLTVLYVETEDITVEGWRIDISPLEADTVSDTLSAWRRNGFTPFGLSLSPSEEVWYLLIDQGEETVPEVYFNGYPKTSAGLRESITADIETASVPWALMVGDETVYVLYLR